MGEAVAATRSDSHDRSGREAGAATPALESAALREQRQSVPSSSGSSGSCLKDDGRVGLSPRASIHRCGCGTAGRSMSLAVFGLGRGRSCLATLRVVEAARHWVLGASIGGAVLCISSATATASWRERTLSLRRMFLRCERMVSGESTSSSAISSVVFDSLSRSMTSHGAGGQALNPSRSCLSSRRAMDALRLLTGSSGYHVGTPGRVWQRGRSSRWSGKTPRVPLVGCGECLNAIATTA